MVKRFLLAQLHLDSLAKKQCKKDVRLSLEALPQSLEKIYDEAMQRICSQYDDDVSLAKRVLFMDFLCLQAADRSRTPACIGYQAWSNRTGQRSATG